MESAKLKHLPNILTFSNMALGILIIFLMLKDNSLAAVKLSCYLIFVAIIFDMFDGYLARYLNATSKIGKQLDSFSDFVSFGIAPVIIFITKLDSLLWYITIILLIYPLAGAFRLARYNLQESCKDFIGLPITAAGFIMTTILLINIYLYDEFTKGFVIFYLLITIVLSIMMVSRFHVSRILIIKDAYDTNSNITDITNLQS